MVSNILIGLELLYETLLAHFLFSEILPCRHVVVPGSSMHVLIACMNGQPSRDTHITSQLFTMKRGKTREREIVRLDQVYILIATRISDTTIHLVCISRVRGGRFLLSIWSRV